MEDLKTTVFVVGAVRRHRGGLHQTEIASGTKVLSSCAEDLGGGGRLTGATERVKEEESLVDRTVPEISVHPVLEGQGDGGVGGRRPVEDLS